MKLAEGSELAPMGRVATVTSTVCQVVDQILGFRARYPLITATVCLEALKLTGAKGSVRYGRACWVEVLEGGLTRWGGAWQEGEFHFWVETNGGEIVDVAAAATARIPQVGGRAPVQYGPPILWSKEIPQFYRYETLGDAETNPDDVEGKKILENLFSRLQRSDLARNPLPEQFLNEPILISGKRLLDDEKQSFLHYDRALRIRHPGKPPF